MTRNSAGWYRGTADAIAQNWDAIEESACDRVLVLSGDHVYRMDYRALLATHEQHGAAVTLAVTRVPADQTHRFGMATLGEGGTVVALEEKPARASTPFASMGIYLFETEVLHEMLRGRPVDLVLDVLRPLIVSGARVFAHIFHGYWEDVGTVGSYYRASQDLLGKEPRLSLDDQRWPILTRDEERPPALFRDGAVIEESLVANGCRVTGRVQRSLLFPGVTVEAGAQIVDSIVMQDVVVGPDARVECSILDKYVRVGAGARIGSADGKKDGELGWLEGLTLAGKDAILPSGVRIHAPAVIGVGTVAEDFRDGTLGAGSVIPNRIWYEERS
jgi:glucose-1-phosphate adenylyltransferase